MAPGLKSHDRAAEIIRRLGVKLRIIASRKARLKDRIERNQAKVDRDRKLLGSLNVKDQAIADRYALSIYRFERDNSDHDFNDLKRSELVLRETTGTVRIYKASTNKLIFNGEEQETITEILSLHPELFFKLVKCEIRRNNLKAMPEILDELSTAAVEQGVFCAIQPANTGEKYARPVAHFERLLALSSD